MTTVEPPVRLALPGRTLLLVAGMPGAGKSTLLASLPPAGGVVVLDSEAQRAAVRSALPRVRYAWVRPLVHVLHRAAVLVAALSRVPTVVVHLPATQPRARALVARLAALTGRAAHLLWLQVGVDEARRGQRARGRVVPEGSFAGHARHAAATAAELLERPPPGWRSITVLDRAAARGGLRLETGPDRAHRRVPAHPAGRVRGRRDVCAGAGERAPARPEARPGHARDAAALTALQRVTARK